MIYRDYLENRAVRWLAWSFALSFFLHLSFVIAANYFSKSKHSVSVVRPLSPPINVSLVNIETLQEESEIAPEDAKFISDRNLRAEEETSPELETTSVLQPDVAVQGREKVDGKQSSRAEKLESFSLSESDKLALNNPLLQDRVNKNPLPLSKGFMERLKRGNELRANALRHDASSFINRIQRKIQVIWNPRSTIQADMYRYREVRTVLGIVLTNQGELFDLKVVEPSFFPQFDEEAIRSVRKGAPFANPPSFIIQDDGFVYFSWTFTLTLSNFGVADIE